MGEQVDQPAQVDRVLGHAAGAEDAHDRREGTARRYAVAHQSFVCLVEAGARHAPVDGEHARCQLPQPVCRQAAAGDLGDNCQVLLGLVIAGEPGAEHLDRLCGTVDLRDEVGADLVMDERGGAVLLHG